MIARMNISELTQILKSHGIRPSRRLGQNFLIDGNILSIIVDCSDIGPQDTILEIGPGLGILTRELCERAKRVFAVEIDSRLARITKKRLAAFENLEILNADILKKKNQLNPDVVERLERFGPFKVVANFPYSVATPFIMNLIKLDRLQTDRMVFSIQKEVGEKLMADGSKFKSEYPGVICNTWGTPEWIKRLSSNVFFPRPAIQSCVIRIDPKPLPFERKHFSEFCSFVRTGFSMPRKKITKSLSRIFDRDVLEKALSETGTSPNSRAADISCEQWSGLFNYTTPLK